MGSPQDWITQRSVPGIKSMTRLAAASVSQTTPTVRNACRTLSGWLALKGMITLGSGITSIIVCPSSSYIENWVKHFSWQTVKSLILIPIDGSKLLHPNQKLRDEDGT
jgi:hypothetical protein